MRYTHVKRQTNWRNFILSQKKTIIRTFYTYTDTYTHLCTRCWAASSATRLNRKKNRIKQDLFTKLDLASNCIYVLVLGVGVRCLLLSKFIIFQDVCIFFSSSSLVCFLFLQFFGALKYASLSMLSVYFIVYLSLFFYSLSRILSSSNFSSLKFYFLVSIFRVFGIRNNEWRKKKTQFSLTNLLSTIFAV